MPILLNADILTEQPGSCSGDVPISDAISLLQKRLSLDQVIVRFELDGLVIEGTSLTAMHGELVGSRRFAAITSTRKNLSLSLIGKIAAFVEWLAPLHKEAASQLEKGNAPEAFTTLNRIFSSWHQIQQAYGNLARLNCLALDDLQVNGMTGTARMEEFCKSLQEMQIALQNKDMVLLADILQYEMDGAVANWVAILEATLALVENTDAIAV